MSHFIQYNASLNSLAEISRIILKGEQPDYIHAVSVNVSLNILFYVMLSVMIVV